MTTTAPWLGINPAECLKDSDTRHPPAQAAPTHMSQPGRPTNQQPTTIDERAAHRRLLTMAWSEAQVVP